MGDDQKRVCLGAFAGAHGVRGDVLIKTFTQTPENIAAYGVVESEDRAQKYTLTYLRDAKPGFIVARVEEIKTREDAIALKGMRFYVSREALPKPEKDEYYLEDLVGLKLIDEDGTPTGVVSAVHNFGAGDVIEVKNVPEMKGVHLLAFTKENFLKVVIGDGHIIIRRAALLDLNEPVSDEGISET